MKFLAGLFLDNLAYKAIALLVAVVLWAGVQGARTDQKSLDLPIEIVDLPESVVLVEQSHIEINVLVKGSRAALRAAGRQLTSYPLSLAGLSEGETRLQVAEEILPVSSGAEVVAHAPSWIVVKAESVIRKAVPVRVDLVGELPEGYMLLGVVVEPKEILLAGARSRITQMGEVLTEMIDISQLTESTFREASLAGLGGSLVRLAEGNGGAVEVRLEIEGPIAPRGPGEGREG